MPKSIEDIRRELHQLETSFRETLALAKTAADDLQDMQAADKTQSLGLLQRMLTEYSAQVETRLLPLVTKAMAPPAPTVVNAEKGGKRRAIVRYRRRLTIHYRSPGVDTKMHRGISKDIGAMGLFIVTDHQEQVGRAIYIEATLPDQHVVKLHGTVAWTKWVPPSLAATGNIGGFGVKLTNAPEDWFKYFFQLETSSRNMEATHEFTR